ncbi:caspase, EACC1-associated type [Nocardia yunnanensis]|uniref:caspase, EACC1-associated type n=1 Tax=Nocardia yunnanensis TaxID=2382165 RepID=UPI001FE714E9|nr:glycoside hydrolase family 3 N-terminal domain-containing protein [Nocardia yunnanensis]
MTRIPDKHSSRAVLIGISQYHRDAELAEIAAAERNLNGLLAALTDRGTGTLSPEHTWPLVNPTLDTIGDAIGRASSEASDVLLVYYAGHGLLDDRGRLHLALPTTDPSRIRWTSLPYETLREELANSHATARIILLDCCFSGRAINAMAPQSTVLTGQIDIDGTYVITSTAANQPGYAPPGQTYTAFTDALLTVAADTTRDLTLDDLFTNIDQLLHSRGYPRPQRRAVNTAGLLAIFKSNTSQPNTAHDLPDKQSLPQQRITKAAQQHSNTEANRTRAHAEPTPYEELEPDISTDRDAKAPTTTATEHGSETEPADPSKGIAPPRIGSRRPSRPSRRVLILALAVTVAVTTAVSVSAWGLGHSHSASAIGGSTVPTGATSVGSAQDCSAGYLSQFTLRQKLAQLLTVTVGNSEDALQVVKTEQVGGIFIGGGTDKALLAQHQVDAVQAASRIPLMVAVGEEGGRDSWAKDLIGVAPSARVIAQTMTPDQFYTFSLDRAKKLKALGVTVDLAPDVDVSVQPDDSVIGDRSFSGDPNTVVQYAGAFIRALNDAGVGSVMKHFPGRGSSSGNSQTGAAQAPPLNQMQVTDLVPFRQLVDSGAAVMVGHLDVPGLTSSGIPASISPQVMALLRQGTGYGAAPFTGPILTDDLSELAAGSSPPSVEDAAAEALEAGADDAVASA